MREEANDLRPSFELSSNALLREISNLERENMDILPRYQNIASMVNARKIDDFFKNLSKNGETTRFNDFFNSLVLIGVVMAKKISQEKKRIDGDIDVRQTKLRGLDAYTLFHGEAPTCQLRTKFIEINEILKMLTPRVSASAPIESEIKKGQEKMTYLSDLLSACDVQLSSKGQEMVQVCSMSDWEKVSVLARSIDALKEESETIKKQQGELDNKLSSLTAELRLVAEQKIETDEDLCLKESLAELRSCAEFVNLNAIALENNKFKHNALTVQDRHFISDMLSFLKMTYSW